MTQRHGTPALPSLAPTDGAGARFPEPPLGHRDWYAFEALRALPRLILMIDGNRFSDTYGCFDREFWHYRTVDFPCGMSQEFCLPLALAYAHDFPHNPYRGAERLRELVIASMEFARKASHPDGSTDDYFPFERALGALVFSTYAMTESYLVLGLDRPDLIDFFRLRGDWLIAHNETGQLANHQAFAALALYNVYLLTHDEKYRAASLRFRDITLSWQHDEGWFQEYEGADPGYHSCSIAFLTKLYAKSQDEALVEPIRRAIEFAAYFMHPDGSYAGEYGSRNTYHFYPHGFEYWSDRVPDAAWVAQMTLSRALPERRRYFNDDNRMAAHYVYDWMHAWLDYRPGHGALPLARPPETRYFSDAKLLVKRTARYHAVASAAKGGVIKVFDRQGPVMSDTGLMLRTQGGDVLVPHLVDDEHTSEVRGLTANGSADAPLTLRASGRLSKRRYPLPSPVKQMAFRGMNLTVGRFGAGAVRAILQKVLITGKPRTDARFERTIQLTDDDVVVRDVVDLSATSAVQVEEAAVGSDATSIYVANSNTFQESVLLPWVEVPPADVARLNRERRLALPPRAAFGEDADADADADVDRGAE